MIQNPSYSELQKAENQGRRCTWEKLSAIKANCAIELALDECVALLNHMRRLKRSAERAAAAASHGHKSIVRMNPSRRIPSWNRIARENSTGSFEDVLEEIAASMQQGTAQIGQLSRKAQSTTDGSDSESDTIDLNCWTRSGGPLMKTSSANKLINFVQNLGLEPDPEPRGNSSREHDSEELAGQYSCLDIQTVGEDARHDNSRGRTPDRSSENTDTDTNELASRVPLSASNSIILSQGDLLQPARVHNGIVINVVSREILNQGNWNSSHEQQQYCSPEVVESLRMETGDASSESECGEDNEMKSSCIDEPSSRDDGNDIANQ